MLRVIFISCLIGVVFMFTHVHAIDYSSGSRTDRALMAKIANVKLQSNVLIADVVSLTAELAAYQACAATGTIYDGTSCVSPVSSITCAYGKIRGNNYPTPPVWSGNPVLGAGMTRSFLSGSIHRLACGAGAVAVACSVFGNDDNRLRLHGNSCDMELNDSSELSMACCTGLYN